MTATRQPLHVLVTITCFSLQIYISFCKRVYLYYSALWSLLFPSIVKLQKSSFCQVNTEEASHKHSAPPECAFQVEKFRRKLKRQFDNFDSKRLLLPLVWRICFSRPVIVFPESPFPYSEKKVRLFKENLISLSDWHHWIQLNSGILVCNYFLL